MYTYGYIQSKLNGTELNSNRVCHEVHIPDKFKIDIIDPIRDQGDTPKCVSICLADLLRWKSREFNIDLNIPDDLIYKECKDENENGIEPKKALEFITKGTFGQQFHINYSIYATVPTIWAAKQCLYQYGPILACLPVKSTSKFFWYGSERLGGQAVLLVGYDEDKFIFRNSWGIEWGDLGYGILPCFDYSFIQEAWTIIR